MRERRSMLNGAAAPNFVYSRSATSRPNKPTKSGRATAAQKHNQLYSSLEVCSRTLPLRNPLRQKLGGKPARADHGQLFCSNGAEPQLGHRRRRRHGITSMFAHRPKLAKMMLADCRLGALKGKFTNDYAIRQPRNAHDTITE